MTVIKVSYKRLIIRYAEVPHILESINTTTQYQTKSPLTDKDWGIQNDNAKWQAFFPCQEFVYDKAVPDKKIFSNRILISLRVVVVWELTRHKGSIKRKELERKTCFCLDSEFMDLIFP